LFRPRLRDVHEVPWEAAMRIFGVALIACTVLASVARAEVPAREEVTCPVGGQSFTHLGYAAYSTYGQRLDGKPFGSTSFPLRIPVCPNGFVIYKASADFTEAQIAALASYIQAPEFLSLAEHSTYYRASRLARAAGEPAAMQAWLMLSASWQVDREPHEFAAYQSDFLALADEALAQLPRTSPEWWVLQFRAANAERQLSRFDAAAARLSGLPTTELAEVRLEQGQDVAAWGEGFRGAVATLTGFIVARDASVEPASPGR
jgi:hypothetical protein